MNKQEFLNYASEAIFQSIIALDYNRESLIEYYGNSKKCTLESYFSSQIKGNSLYSQADEQSEETILIANIDECSEVFDSARELAFQKWESLQA